MDITVTRRRFIQCAATTSMLPIIPHVAGAQSYPTRAVRLIVGYAPGGATDITARLLAQSLSTRFGQQFVVENRPGAATNIATGEVVRTPPDGYTLLMATAANAINSSLYRQLSFDFLRDLDMVAGIIKMQNVLEVHPSVPARTVSELVAYAKDNPTKLTFGSAGIGSPGHVSGELFKMMTGTKMEHVPYRGIAPALSDLIAGHIQVLIDNMATAIEHIRTGAVRALAVTTATRSTLLPELPTINETITGYDASSWFGVSAPKGTPRDVVEILNRAINATLDEPSIAERFEKLGGAAMPGSSADFQRFVVEETDKWGRVIRFAGAKAE